MTEKVITGRGILPTERVTAVGWPWHGLCVDGKLQGISEELDEKIGEHVEAMSYRLGYGQNNHLLDMGYQGGDWNHMFLGGSTFDENATMMSGNTTTGYPIRTPSGRTLGVSLRTLLDDAVLLTIYSRGAFAEGNERIIVLPEGWSDTDNAFAYLLSTFGSPPHVVMGRPRPGFSMHRSSMLLDSCGHKILIALTSGRRSQLSIYDYTPENFHSNGVVAGAPDEYRVSSQGRLYSSGLSRGVSDIVAIIELEAAGEDLDDIILRVVADPAAMVGEALKVNPLSVTTRPDSSRSYYHRTLQKDAILSAHYDDAGKVVLDVYSVDHTCSILTNEERQESVLESRLEFKGREVHYRQVLTISKDPDSVTHKNISNKIWQGSELVVDEYLGGKDVGLVFNYMSESDIAGRRAPEFGLDSRVCPAGFAYAVPLADQYLNMSHYSICLRENTPGTYAMYGVIENFGYQEHLVNEKRVSDCHIISRWGDHLIPGFTDSVVWKDERYDSFGVDLAGIKGYIGSRLKGSVHPITGQYHAESIAEPLKRSCWL